LTSLVSSFLFTGSDTREAALALFPADFHPSLRTLLCKLIVARMPEWREVLVAHSVGPAKLVDFGAPLTPRSGTACVARVAAICAHAHCGLDCLLFRACFCDSNPLLCSFLSRSDWRVDMQTSSTSSRVLRAPTLLVEVALQPPPTHVALVEPVRSMQFELSQQALTTLLSGLEKIQSQLSALK
jgi:hypothetical protein